MADHNANLNGFVPAMFVAGCGLHQLEITTSFLSEAVSGPAVTRLAPAQVVRLSYCLVNKCEID